MEPLDEYPIGRAPEEPTPARDRQTRAWAIVAVVLLVAGALVALYVTRPSREPGPASTDPARAAAPPSAPPPRGRLGPDVEQRELPPLDLSDPLVRELLSGLSSRPELAAWLASDGLIRNFVASVDAVANGRTPAPLLRRLAPKTPFVAETRGDRFVVDPRSHARYDGLADTVAALDAGGLARAYATLRPRLLEAYRELGYPDGNVDVAVERALTRLLETPMLAQGLEVQPAPVLYQYTDPRVEKLSPAQKQLLRTGPRNQRLVQDKLREIAGALGIANVTDRRN